MGMILLKIVTSVVLIILVIGGLCSLSHVGIAYVVAGDCANYPISHC